MRSAHRVAYLSAAERARIVSKRNPSIISVQAVDREGREARDSRVCVYDRAGRGWSDLAASPPDGAQIATDLHMLLHRTRAGPYVLADIRSAGCTCGPMPRSIPARSLDFSLNRPEIPGGCGCSKETAIVSAPRK